MPLPGVPDRPRLFDRHASWWGAGVLLAVFFVAVAVLSRRFPAITTDEVFTVSHGTSLLDGGRSRYALYDDLFALSVYSMRDAFAQILETATNAWFGLWVSLLGKGFWQARLASAGAAAAALVVAFALGRSMVGARFGLGLMTILAADPALWAGACVVRPEALLLFTTLLTIFVLVRAPDRPWKPWLAGLLSGLQFSVHPNAAAITAGFLVFEAVRPGGDRIRRLVTMALGTAFAFAGVLLSAGIPRLHLVSQGLTAQLVQPLILEWPLPLGKIMQALWGRLYLDHTVLWSEPLLEACRSSLTIRAAAGIAVAMGGLAVYRAGDAGLRRLIRPFAAGAVAVWIASALLVQSSELLYKLNVAPFVIPIAALVLRDRLWDRLRWGAAFRVGVVGLWLAALGVAGSRVPSVMQRAQPIPEVMTAFHHRMPGPDARIVAPSIFWYEWPSDQFRDIGALVYSYWYSGNRQEALKGLSRWRPHILIVDDAVRRIVLKGQPLENAVPARVRRLEPIETGAGWMGTLDVYALEW